MECCIYTEKWKHIYIDCIIQYIYEREEERDILKAETLEYCAHKKLNNTQTADNERNLWSVAHRSPSIWEEQMNHWHLWGRNKSPAKMFWIISCPQLQYNCLLCTDNIYLMLDKPLIQLSPCCCLPFSRQMVLVK